MLKICFKYCYSGKNYVVDEKGDARVNFDVIQNDQSIAIKLKNSLPIIINHFSATMDYEYSNVAKVYLNGYQSWTTSKVYNLDEKVNRLGWLGKLVDFHFAVSKYGDYNFIKYSKLYSHVYAYLINNDNTITLFGSNNEYTGYTVIRFNPKEQNIVFEKDLKGLNIFGNYDLLDVSKFNGKEDNVFDQYFGEKKDAKANHKLLKGYTSWYRHYQNIDEAKIANDLKGFEESKINFNVFQIDDGYQQFVGDWLKLDKRKFPNGLDKIASRINQSGMVAGIWSAPFVAEEKSDLFKEHQDWFAKDAKGRPVKAGCNWSGFYCLDVYNENVREYLRQVYAHYQKMGFKLFKLDFLYAACIPERSNKSRGQVMNEAMDFLREVLKDSLILGCGLPMGAAFGKVDYCRIGCDAGLSWDDKWYMRHTNRERVSTKNAIGNTIARAHLDGRVFYNDPDVYILRNSEDVTLTQDEKLKLFQTNLKYGSVIFTSDDIALYDLATTRLLNQVKDL